MAGHSISCCHLKPPSAPPRDADHLPRLRRACVAGAACVVVGAAAAAAAAGAIADGNSNSSGGAANIREMGDAQSHVGAALMHKRPRPAPPRWSDRRQCPPWRANKLENIVPENLPRALVRRGFQAIAAADMGLAPAASSDAFLKRPSGMGCFSL